MRLVAAALLAACSSPLPQADNAALILSQHLGSGVYVGGGRMLSNWHVCLAPLFDDSLAAADHLTYYDAAAPTMEGPPPSSFYCASGSDDWVVSDTDQGGCLAFSNLPTQRLSFSRRGIETSPQALLFADWTLDACLFTVDAPALATLNPIVLRRTPVEVGERVIVVGEQAGAINEVGIDECAVTAPVAPIVDPDPIAPSPLEVPSFAIDCRKVEHGSSGSPVFAADGRLLGLVWTGVDLGADPPTVYVSAVSAWPAAARPGSNLAALLASQSEE